MIPASTLQREAVKYSRSLLLTVDVWDKGELRWPNVAVTGGSISSDRDRQTRLTCNVDLVLEPYEATKIGVKSVQFNVKRGLTSIGVKDQVSLGWFRADEIDRSNRGQVKLKGSGRESYVIDDRFWLPRTPSFGSGTVQQISALIKESVPTARVRALNTQNRQVRATAPWKTERWDAIDSLADTINAEVFANYAGDFIIADKPTLAGPVVAWFDEGDGGLLLSRNEKETRARVYNAAIVTGNSSDPNVLPCYGFAVDGDPNSDTYYYGAFGHVPRFYVSQFFTSNAQCQAYADNLLIEAKAENQTLSFDAPPIDFLETGDRIGVRRTDGTATIHLLDTFNYGLGVDGSFNAHTLSSKTEAVEF